jgi:hypothetical protein
MLQLSNTINGRFVEYTNDKSIILVPTEGNNFQVVVSQLIEKNGATLIELFSKVGELSADRDNHQVILTINQELLHSRIVIKDCQLIVTAEILLQNCTEQLLREVILEVSAIAYHLDHREVSLPQEEALSI